MKNDPYDRFGTPDEAFIAARQSHGESNPLVRMGMYVPTRHEVATMAPRDLLEVLDLWIWESPIELIPRREQIVQVREVLVSRPDAQDTAVQEVLDLVDDYLSGGG